MIINHPYYFPNVSWGKKTKLNHEDSSQSIQGITSTPPPGVPSMAVKELTNVLLKSYGCLEDTFVPFHSQNGRK